MSYDFNKVMLMGNVGADPYFSIEGKRPFASFSFATNKQYKSGDKPIKETHWHKLVCYSNLAQLVGQYVFKGCRLFIVGELEYRKWMDKEGNEQLSPQIVIRELHFLDRKTAQDIQDISEPSSEESRSDEEFSSDDIPF